ncbi:MAG TPA: RluA family pseudouridine synthase [Kofleriaceae bacterium]|nr:RluA family pseudouridine synthase [Kofleriaceae bacterium]
MAIDDQPVHLDENGNPRIVERRFVVDENFGGWRLDHFLKRMIPRLSRTKLQEIIRTQVQRSGGGEVKPSAAVAVGEEIVLRREARPEPPCPRDFGVLYDHPLMMVIDKPAGLPVHVSAKFYFNTLTRVMWERYPQRRLQICHRLDRETSGALVLADGREAAAMLKGQFAAHRVHKTYLAVVHGQPAWDQRDIDLPLGLTRRRDALIDIRMEVRTGAPPALTQAVVVDRAGGFALVRCHPVTGRQHQIRAHLAAVGHAIVGDKLYAHGDACFIEYCEKGMTDDLLARLLLPRQALHAASIELLHPETREPFRVDCPLPADLAAFLSAART